MSKTTFSKKIHDIMSEKILCLDNIGYDKFLKKDNYFELALCLSYMTLSKEKIIKKDMKNTNRLTRLTKLVDQKYIDEVFKPTFSEKLPNTIYAKENDNTWILDNIRDSIMHGAFEIDEEKELFLINNSQYDRGLIAEIPFSWFISYAKYDILNKKTLDIYQVNGVYYNYRKIIRKNLDTKKEIVNNILYNVKITGTKFNVTNIEKRIKEIFKEESTKYDISKEMIEKYQSRIKSEKIKYNEKYLVSFYMASDVVKEKIEKEFPGVSVKIYINNNKYRLINKISKKMKPQYKNYNLLYNDLSNSIDSKSKSLLNYISSIIENLDNIPENYLELNPYEQMHLFNKLLKNNTDTYLQPNDIYINFKKNLNLLKSICINVCGLSTLVINHNDIYNQYFLNDNTSKFGLEAYSKDLFIKYIEKEKELIIKLLEKEIILSEKKKQSENCNNPQGKIIIDSCINKITNEKNNLLSELDELRNDINPHINTKLMDEKKINILKKKLERYNYHFNQTQDKYIKNKIRKLISKTLDELYEEQIKGTSIYCKNMKEIVTIIRNSFSHIGRINVITKPNGSKIIVLNDYDNNQNHTGRVVGQYDAVMALLGIPLEEENLTKKKTINKEGN